MAKGITKIVIAVLLIVFFAYTAVFGLSLSSLNIPVKIHGVMDEDNGIRFGFDLTGGSVIVYEADTAAPTDDQMDTVVDIMYKRLTNLGFTEATVTKQGDNRVSVEIPTVTNPDEAIKILGATAQLSFVDSEGKTVLTGKDVKNAEPMYGPLSENGASVHFVQLTFNSNAQASFYDATTRMSQKPEGENYISIKLDDEVYSQPSVAEPINSDTCVISGDFDAETAKQLATTIKEGQLPFQLKVVERRSSGPILGEDALNSSLLAAGIGIILIMLFMIFAYRLPGLVSSISLLAYIVILAYALLLTKANLSLAGIAGIILSIGMAVDANVIIFERIKEELKSGKTLGASLKAGFNRAISAILDGQITTAIAAVVLFIFGTGTIKGFAITLGLGIIISLFTAVIVTRFLLNAVFSMNVKNLWLYGLSKKKAKEEN